MSPTYQDINTRMHNVSQSIQEALNPIKLSRNVNSKNESRFKLSIIKTNPNESSQAQNQTIKQATLLTATSYKSLIENINPFRTNDNLFHLYSRLKDTVATEQDIKELINILNIEFTGVTQALRNLSNKGQLVQEYLIDNLQLVVADLKANEIPLASLQMLFIGCEEFYQQSNQQERCPEDSYHTMAQQTQMFAAKQWSFHAKQLHGESSPLANPLHLYKKRSNYHSAHTQLIQQLEDLNIQPNSDLIEILFNSHDAVRAAINQFDPSIVSLDDFEKTLGSQGWHTVKSLIDMHIQDRFPEPLTSHDPDVQAFMHLSSSPCLPKGLAEVIHQDAATVGSNWNNLILSINKGLEAVSTLAKANRPSEIETALDGLMKAAVKLAGIRPDDQYEKTLFVGEDDRVTILSVLLRSSPDLREAFSNAVFGYIVTPYAGGGEANSRANSTIVAANKILT